MYVEKNQPSVVVEEAPTAVVYFTPEEGADSPELLLFEESQLRDPNWRQRASQSSKQFWARTKIKMERLTADIFASDRFVRRLKGFHRITVLLNKPIDPALVRERLRIILRDRSYHHLRWLIVDGLLLPLSVLIAPIPGPNVIGYYLLFRVYSHWRGFRAASKTTLDEIDVCVSNRAEEVNSLLRKSKDIKTALQELRRRYGLRALQEHRFISQRSVLREAWTRMKNSLAREDEEV
jgi:K+-H+ exchange-related protein